jgi:hypothetical protein
MPCHWAAELAPQLFAVTAVARHSAGNGSGIKAGMDESQCKQSDSDRGDDCTAARKALDKIDELFELRNWRIGVMICIFIAAFVTPPDPFSLIFVAVPLVVAYFIGVGVRAWRKREENS